MLVETLTHLAQVEYNISLADVRAFTFVYFYHESWQNDIKFLQF